MNREPDRPVCDYEGSAYRTDFWGQGRDYEDRVERAALRRMLPTGGHRLVDVGGGYGRLVPLYAGYDEVVIFDYALSQLREAQDLWGSGPPGGQPRLIFVAGDFYRLPFASATFETVVIVRALHHAADAPAVLRGVSRLLERKGTLVLEFANKRNLKAILRYVLGRQDWSPFDAQPVEFVPLNFDFHPAWIRDRLAECGLSVRARRGVSSFRLNLLKARVPTALLVTLDRLLQPLGKVFPLSPSVFVRCTATHGSIRAQPDALFRCIECDSTRLDQRQAEILCTACGSSFPIRDGIYDFRPAQRQEAPAGLPNRTEVK